MLSRRTFLGATLAWAAMPWPGRSWAWAAPGAGPEAPVLVVVFLRGAADGLSIVAPYQEARYHDLRPNLALGRPGTEGGLLDLEPRFGLHPALSPLLPWYRDGRLAFVHAAGSPDPTRSHFDAQDYMETGKPGDRSAREGWLNRGLAALGATGNFAGVALTPVQPVIFGGPERFLCVPDLRALSVRGGQAVTARFEEMYAGAVQQVLGRAGRDAFAAVDETRGGRLARVGAGSGYPRGRLGLTLSDIARLIRSGVGTRLAFTDAGGWDTHTRQGPVLAERLAELGSALAAFAADLGPLFDRTIVLVLSEFGRTVAENGTRGTDHGHGGVIWALGGRLRGGRVCGKWPGLAEDALFEGRDLAVTTDFRDVVGEVWARHMGPGAERLFPGYSGGGAVGLFG
ncbi:MAG: DUF1501 domain-containing protein [Candidatus Sericytochromatia bacterium]|nr:DUF1501 domain-containing protein [Candidatus Tanganyikabacteria bacterium]